MFKVVKPNEAYEYVTAALMKEAQAIGANGIIHIHYDYRVAVNKGFISANQVFEVFAYGTAVLRDVSA
jgi:uncharacterized protein YbjQ (UPF0145 family)